MRNYRRNKNIVERKIHGASYLIDISDNYMDEKCHLYEMNDMGDIIWNIIDESSKVESQIDYIVLHIKKMIIDDIPYDVIRMDVESFFNSIKNEGFIEVI